MPEFHDDSPAAGTRRPAPSVPVILAAIIVLVAGPALALDRERAVPAPTLEPCPSKGPGFVRVPGSGTCTRLSGRVSAGAAIAGDASGVRTVPGATGRFSIDTRTDSDFGEVRTYLRLGNGRR